MHGPDSRSIVRDISGLQGYIKFLEDELFAVIDKDMLKYVRGELSATCVTNSDGVVTILEGRTAQKKRVTDEFTMFQKELEALWKRKDLPDATRQNAAAMIAGYLTHYDGQRQLSEQIVLDAHAVMRKARHTRKSS